MAHGRPNKAVDGVLTYPQRGWEPPPEIAGYRRKSNNLKSPDAWTFIPILPPCEYRSIKEKIGQCGAISIKYFCKGTRINDLSICGRCTM
jgi:hypothetical protein